MNVDFIERDVVGELEAKHYHPRDPEKDDVETCNENTGWIEGCQFCRLLWPAQGGKRP